ncbi:MAG: histidine kinase [Hyphomicrobiaceae bacterium]
MPSLFRFLFVVGSLAAIAYAGLYVMAVYFEPEPREIRKPLPSINVSR